MSDLDFLTSQLEQLDPNFKQPLGIVTAGRDIDFLTVAFGVEKTSYLKSKFGATGVFDADDIPFAGAASNSSPGVSVDNLKLETQFREVHRNIAYSQSELDKSAKMLQAQGGQGVTIDVAKVMALNRLYQLDLDKAVYLGALTAYPDFYGLVNNVNIDTATVDAGASTFTEWDKKTPDEIVKDVSDGQTAAWEASGLSFPPNKLLIPPKQYAYISSQKVSDAGNISILNYIKLNSLGVDSPGGLDIQPLKFLTAGNGKYSANNSADRMVFYTMDIDLVRFPLAMMEAGEAYKIEWNYIRPYRYGFGQVEFIYPETIAYRDGI